MTLLEASNLEINIGERQLIRDLNVEIGSGESWALLGCNGAGKTTLLHTLAHLRPHHQGVIKIRGKNIKSLKRRELAQRIGLLFQEGLSMMPSTVMEMVILGRYPHQKSLLWDDF